MYWTFDIFNINKAALIFWMMWFLYWLLLTSTGNTSSHQTHKCFSFISYKQRRKNGLKCSKTSCKDFFLCCFYQSNYSRLFTWNGFFVAIRKGGKSPFCSFIKKLHVRIFFKDYLFVSPSVHRSEELLIVSLDFLLDCPDLCPPSHPVTINKVSFLVLLVTLVFIHLRKE